MVRTQEHIVSFNQHNPVLLAYFDIPLNRVPYSMIKRRVLTTPCKHTQFLT